MDRSRSGSDVMSAVVCPFSLRVGEIAAMLNFELADHPVYDGVELQWFDDDVHGTGLLAFLSRREGRRVDYYVERDLRVDRGGYEIGGGTGRWTETSFEAARLVVADDGVEADVRFTDVDGRVVEVRVDDRDGRPRRRAGLLAPVSAGIERPVSLMLVWMPRFDLVRSTHAPSVVRIDGRQWRTGRLPAARVHRRRLVKYAAPVVTVEVNRTEGDGAQMLSRDQQIEFDETGDVVGVTAGCAGHRATLRLRPAVPELSELRDGAQCAGRWHVEVDGTRLTGGTWSLARTGTAAQMGLDVDERWNPGRLPWLMRLVTTVVPTFRNWPTTYRWRAEVHLDEQADVAGRWERIGSERGHGYRRATGS